MKEKLKAFLKKYRWGLLTWVLIIVLVEVGIYFQFDKTVIGLGVLLLGIAGQAFAIVLAWIGLVPLVGPLVVHVLSLPIIWIINGFGYLASVLAIKKGHKATVVNVQVITVTLIIGVTIGYILGKVL